jgi:hypothetical protein
VIAALRAARVLEIGWRDASLFSDIPKLAAAAIASGIITAAVYVLLIGARPIIVLGVCAIVFSVCYTVAIIVLKVLTAEERESTRLLIARLWRTPWKRAPEPLL